MVCVISSVSECFACMNVKMQGVEKMLKQTTQKPRSTTQSTKAWRETPP